MAELLMVSPERIQAMGLAAGLPTPDLLNLLTPAGLAELRAHPNFRAAVERAAAGGVAHYLATPDEAQWMMRDLGRVSILLTAIILEAYDGFVTAQSLTARCMANQTSSRGRVMQFLKRAQDCGQMLVPPGSDVWTQRPLQLSPALTEHMRTRGLVELKSIQFLHPEIGDAEAVIRDADAFRRFLSWLAVFTTMRQQLIEVLPDNPLRFFLDREVGMLILFDLIAEQAPGRRELLETARLSRNALSQRFGVSRIHINRLFADAAEAGWVSLPASDRVTFSPALSQAIEHLCAVNFQVARASALASNASAPRRS